jgi:alpha-galactosidase
MTVRNDFKLRCCVALLLVFAGGAIGGAGDRTPSSSRDLLAATPPMGWNSWDGFGATIGETEFRATADWLAKHLERFGWQYVVVDAEWYVTNPVAEGSSKTFRYTVDQYGRFTPPASRFPSAANDNGFRPLADYVHSLGLKFGIHILRGIPKEAVEKNLPIPGSAYHAADAADTSDTCPWNYDNYGIDASKPAGQAYYDSIVQLYASWGVDFIKVDCISSHPYKGDEIRMLSAALGKTDRPIVLSLSPGPAPVEKAEELQRHAQLWRISDDIWDLWHGDTDYPQGVGDQFANAAKWAAFSGPGHWPDADMLPIGRLGPAPGFGKARETRLTHDEQRTLLTLWSMFRSPLILGGDLRAADEWTISLLTNPEVIAVDQHSIESRPVISTDTAVVWLSKSATGSWYYVAVFNISSTGETRQYDWKQLGLNSAKYRVRDLWARKGVGWRKSLEVTLPSHGCVLYSVEAEKQ